MIKQLRIDERLIHGQITTQWSRYLDVSTLIVANDVVAADKLTTQALLMTAPAGKKVFVKTVEETIKLLSDPRATSMSILLIVDNPKDAVELVQALNIKVVNVANYRKKVSGNKVTIHNYCAANAEDFILFEQLCEVTETVIAQMLPTVQQDNFKELMKAAKNKQQ